MAKYDPKSLKAEEFINHEEILETIRYAQENKNNFALIDEILKKAAPKKSENGKETHCAGLSHREAAVLLACDDPATVERIYRLAEEIKLAFYGNRIVIFAPCAARVRAPPRHPASLFEKRLDRKLCSLYQHKMDTVK